MSVLENEHDLAYVQKGESVLEYVSSHPTDLILLDILMPGMNGYEVCSRLKADERTRDIPVIFITSKSEDEDETKGFELGAVDYITKPFSFPIVRARVNTHLALKQAMQELESQNTALREAADLREDVERITRHDLKSPLVAIIGFTKLALMDNMTPKELRNCFELIDESSYRMLEMINLSLDLIKMEQGRYQLNLSEVDFLSLIRKVESELGSRIKSKSLLIHVSIDGTRPKAGETFKIRAEELLCYSMLSNLIKNAIEASPRHGSIAIDLCENEWSAIRIRNQGAVPEEIRESFFDKYVTSGKPHGTGLGTYSAKLIAETHGGSIEMNSCQKQGTTVSIHLPL